MQTFMPYLSFDTTAKCLDVQRLGKQRVEAWQIYQALTHPDYGWQNHPAVKMWRGHDVFLLRYGKIICMEWIRRGYNDTLLPKFETALGDRPYPEFPGWFGDPKFHQSHQSNLCRKAPWHYRQFFPDVNMSLPYVWPSQ